MTPDTQSAVTLIVEDDPDIQLLIETALFMDARFTLANVTESAEEALESARTTPPEIILLDHGLAGALTGLAAAPQLKALAPHAKIVLFTAHAELKVAADQEPAIDAFLLKTDSTQLLALAQRLTGPSSPQVIPAAWVRMDASGVIRFVSRQAELLFGYDGDDLGGQPIETLIPEPVRKIYEEYWREGCSDPRARARGFDLVLSGRRRDGSWFSIGINVCRVETRHGLSVIAEVCDLTDGEKAGR